MTVPAGHTPTLHELQQWMAALIVTPANLDAPARLAFIDVADHATAIQRLKVYADGYPARLHEALAESFPAVEHVVGQGAFSGLVHRYVAAVSLHSYNLNDAGAALPDFMRHDPLTTQLPFLPGLAQLEWCVARAFHARDAAPIDPASLASWDLNDWERAVFRFQPSVALVSSDWPIREIWEHRETPIEQMDIDVSNRPERVLVCRASFEVRCVSLEAPEARVFAGLLAGQTLGAVAAQLAGDGGNPAAVSTWFARWMELGTITACHRPSTAQ